MDTSFLEKYTGLDSPLHRLDPRVKLVTLFLLAILTATLTPGRYFALAFFGLTALLLALVSGIPWRFLVTRLSVILPFVLMAALFVPFADPPGGSGAFLLMFFLKAVIAFLAVLLVSATTPFSAVLKAMEGLKVPAVFTAMLGFLYRYTFTLAEEAARMKRARDSRAYAGRWLVNAADAGRFIGMFFLRSVERAERVYRAMASRGYAGRFRAETLPPVPRRDLTAGALMASAFLLARFAGAV